MGRNAELQRERRSLQRAEQHILDGEMRIVEQHVLVRELKRDEHDAELSEWLLHSLEATLAEWQNRRDVIAKRIAELERIAG